MSTRKEEIKVNENIAVNEPKFNEKNTTKFSTNNTNTTTNFNERTNIDYNNTLNQQQDAINKTLDNTLHNVRRTTDEATREIPRYTQRIAEYQEQTIQTIKDIASDFIEAEKEAIGSFQSQLDRNSGGVWDVYNPQRIAENHAVMVNNFTSYLLNTSNLINNALASNIRVYNTALEQTRDNLKAFAKTNTNYIKSVEQSVNRYNSDVNTSNLINNALASNMRVYNTALEQTRDNLKAFAKTNTDCVKAVSGNSQNREVNTN